YGELRETDPEMVAPFEAYKKLRAGARHVLARPGENIPLEGLELTIISADSQTLKAPVTAKAGEDNPACATFERRREDTSENGRSGGLWLRFGEFRLLDPGDLSWNGLAALVCPRNLIGGIDAYVVGHHGNADTNVPALLAAIKPRVAIVNNGPRKGGVTSTLATLRHLNGLAALWQLHQSRFDGADNAPDDY